MLAVLIVEKMYRSRASAPVSSYYFLVFLKPIRATPLLHAHLPSYMIKRWYKAQVPVARTTCLIFVPMLHHYMHLRRISSMLV
jgi:hypothetical protein